MLSTKIHEQTILEISQGDYIGATIDSFLIDRQARDLSRHTIRFYREFLRTFNQYCTIHSVSFIQQVTPDFLRRYFLAFGEKHNPGGVHGAYRSLRAFFQWLVKEEIMAAHWKNPMQKVKAPKVVLGPLDPISIEDIRALINTCQRGNLIGERDRAIFLFLLDTGARAQELCNMNIKEIDMNTGAVMIRYGKGGKTRMVFMGRKTRRALRAYLRMRQDRGHGSISAASDGSFYYDRKESSNQVTIHPGKQRFAGFEPLAVYYNFNHKLGTLDLDEFWFTSEDLDTNVHRVREALLSYLALGTQKTNAVVEHLKPHLGRNNVLALLKELVDSGDIVKGRQGRSDIFSLSSPEQLVLPPNKDIIRYNQEIVPTVSALGLEGGGK